jgi:hypothetical protein
MGPAPPRPGRVSGPCVVGGPASFCSRRIGSLAIAGAFGSTFSLRRIERVADSTSAVHDFGVSGTRTTFPHPAARPGEPSPTPGPEPA